MMKRQPVTIRLRRGRDRRQRHLRLVRGPVLPRRRIRVGAGRAGRRRPGRQPPGHLSNQQTFYVQLSRARENAVVLTDNREQLIETLEANTGERITALEAIGEAAVREVPAKAEVGAEEADAFVERLRTEREHDAAAAARPARPRTASTHGSTMPSGPSCPLARRRDRNPRTRRRHDSPTDMNMKSGERHSRRS